MKIIATGITGNTVMAVKGERGKKGKNTHNKNENQKERTISKTSGKAAWCKRNPEVLLRLPGGLSLRPHARLQEQRTEGGSAQWKNDHRNSNGECIQLYFKIYFQEKAYSIYF